MRVTDATNLAAALDQRDGSYGNRGGSASGGSEGSVIGGRPGTGSWMLGGSVTGGNVIGGRVNGGTPVGGARPPGSVVGVPPPVSAPAGASEPAPDGEVSDVAGDDPAWSVAAPFALDVGRRSAGSVADPDPPPGAGRSMSSVDAAEAIPRWIGFGNAPTVASPPVATNIATMAAAASRRGESLLATAARGGRAATVSASDTAANRIPPASILAMSAALGTGADSNG